MQYIQVDEKRLSGNGFTLIELSIVLVIVGLIIGGILVGQSMIAAAAVRSQLTQFERLQTAMNVFKAKYGYFPGDLLASKASSLGFASRGGSNRAGDGNGLIEPDSVTLGSGIFGGSWNPEEYFLFFNDLTYANGQKVALIDGNFTGVDASLSDNDLPNYFPRAKLGGGVNYVYVWAYQSHNYFGLSGLSVSGVYTTNSVPASVRVSDAFQIDQKIDDGLPQRGRVTAIRLGFLGTGYDYDSHVSLHGDNGASDTTTATPPTATTCYDDRGSTGSQRLYSMQQSLGNGTNCALAIQLK